MSNSTTNVQLLPATTRAIHIVKAAAPEHAFEVRTLKTGRPGTGEVLIKVRAAGVNFADILARQGLYPEAPKRPCVVGYEVSGVVVAAGDDVDPSWLGKSVMALTDFGGYAETVRVSHHHIWEKPASLSFEEAASIPLNYLTAWGLLVAMGGLGRGDTVLIHNAGGGVGLAALEVARHVGARVLGTASPGKHAFLTSRGLDHAIDYTRDDWPGEVMRLTGGKGVELAIDPVGGKHWNKTFGVLRATGRMAMFGISAAATGAGPLAMLGLIRMFVTAPRYHVGNLFPTSRGVFGLNVHGMYGEWEKLDRWMQEVLAGVAQGWVAPHVDKVFRFDEAAAAHMHLEARGNIGKVVLVP